MISGSRSTSRGLGKIWLILSMFASVLVVAAGTSNPAGAQAGSNSHTATQPASHMQLRDGNNTVVCFVYGDRTPESPPVATGCPDGTFTQLLWDADWVEITPRRTVTVGSPGEPEPEPEPEPGSHTATQPASHMQLRDGNNTVVCFIYGDRTPESPPVATGCPDGTFTQLLWDADWVEIKPRRTVTIGSPVEPETNFPSTDGPLSAPHPTIENISLLWDTVGDSNGNSTVAVRYRQRGSSDWLEALPLRRVRAGNNVGFSWRARHAGSIFNVKPGTVYEVQATLTDPDGPNDTRSISVRTRNVPTAMANAPIKSATPSNLSSVLNSAQPGDIVRLSAGTYNEFDINRSGTAGKPIVIRGSSGTVVNGEIGIFSQSDVHVEDLTVNGRIRFNGSDRIAITGNTINASLAFNGDGIITNIRSEDSYIADNTVNGVTVWREAALSINGDNDGEGILVTGPGHVIEHNKISGMEDGISFQEDSFANDQFSIDVLRNDISEAGDDGIEADFCMHNCRIMENQLTNTFVAFSSQPSLGGPTYFVRNTAYNVGHVAFKLYRGSRGDVIFHNTVVKDGDAFGIRTSTDVRDLYMRNNLIIGGPGDSYNGFSNGSGLVMSVPSLDESSADTNYNGYGSLTGTFTGRFGDTRFNSLSEMRSRTTERNSIEVGLNSFATTVSYPENAANQYGRKDLRLSSSSPAVNAGEALPTINITANGAPDLGAFERGTARPAYGPRS